MKVLFILLSVIASVAPHGGISPIRFPNSRPYGRQDPIGAGPEGRLYLEECKHLQGNNPSKYGKEYHFSWCYDRGVKYNWNGANAYCYSLGNGWTGLTIDSPKENYFISDIIERHRLPYIWTNGRRVETYNQQSGGSAWEWAASNKLISYFNWGRTGGLGRPQPDNNENNNENCLGILNYFYEGDTITWHDIGCHHTKPIICQRRGGYQG